MQTYSHFILTAALGGGIRDRVADGQDRLPPMSMSALLLGSVLPDLLLTALGVMAIGRDWITGVFSRYDFFQLPPGTPPPQEMIDASLTMKLFEVWFFENPWVIAAQNLFHSPLILALLLAGGYMAWRRGYKAGNWLFWLAGAAMVHTLIDIPLHTKDGPLLLFPLNWRWRFESPLQLIGTPTITAASGASWNIFWIWPC